MPARSETAHDKSAIATLIARTYMEEGAATIEQTSVLRCLDSYDVGLSFVCENDDGKLSAFSLYTPVDVDGKAGAVVLAPFAVDTNDADFDAVPYLKETFKAVKSKGVRYIFVMGILDDLSALGFVFADTLGFTLEGNPPVSLLVKDLGGSNELTGQVNFPEVLLS